MAESVYLSGMTKVQLQWQNHFHDPIALNTFWVYAADSAGASITELSNFCGLLLTAITAESWRSYVNSSHELANITATDWSGPLGATGQSGAGFVG